MEIIDNNIKILEPVLIEQGTVTVKHKHSVKRKKRSRAEKSTVASEESTSLIDLLIKQCLICFALLAILTIINFIGIQQVYQSVVKIMESSSITDYFSGVKPV